MKSNYLLYDGECPACGAFDAITAPRKLHPSAIGARRSAWLHPKLKRGRRLLLELLGKPPIS